MELNTHIRQILSNYCFQILGRIQDFLLSEIDGDNLKETIGFINANNKDKKANYKDILYQGKDYKGLFIEGNQYLISSSKERVLVIDMIGEENGMSKEYTRIEIPKVDFIMLISNKKEVLEQIKKM